MPPVPGRTHPKLTLRFGRVPLCGSLENPQQRAEHTRQERARGAWMRGVCSGSNSGMWRGAASRLPGAPSAASGTHPAAGLAGMGSTAGQLPGGLQGAGRMATRTAVHPYCFAYLLALRICMHFAILHIYSEHTYVCTFYAWIFMRLCCINIR